MPDPAAADPHTLVFDSQGDLWFTVQDGNFVGKLTTATGTIQLVRVPTSGARPYGIVVDTSRPALVHGVRGQQARERGSQDDASARISVAPNGCPATTARGNVYIEEIKTVAFVPQSLPFVGRVIGTLRREYLDHLFYWNEADLERRLLCYRHYYNQHRCHTGLNGETPNPT